jgi:hypothetical protein
MSAKTLFFVTWIGLGGFGLGGGACKSEPKKRGRKGNQKAAKNTAGPQGKQSKKTAAENDANRNQALCEKMCTRLFKTCFDELMNPNDPAVAKDKKKGAALAKVREKMAKEGYGRCLSECAKMSKRRAAVSGLKKCMALKSCTPFSKCVSRLPH